MSAAARQATARQADPRLAAEFLRYLAVSLVALAIDFACLLALAAAGLHYLVANAVGFAAGALAAYLGSIRWVFARRRVKDGRLEFTLFAGVGVAGLLVNEAALWAGVALAALPLPAAKLAAAGASFAFNYALRRAILFR